MYVPRLLVSVVPVISISFHGMSVDDTDVTVIVSSSSSIWNAMVGVVGSVVKAWIEHQPI